METGRLYEDPDLLDLRGREEAEERMGVELLHRHESKGFLEIYRPYFEQLMKAADEGALSLKDIASIAGADATTVGRWHRKKSMPILFEQKDMEITPGRLYFLGESEGRLFLYGRGYQWQKYGKDVFADYIYPQLLQLAGILPRQGKENCTTRLFYRDGYGQFVTEIAVTMHSFLKALAKAGFLLRQDSGFRAAIQVQKVAQPYFQGLFDNHGNARLDEGSSPYIHFSAGREWRKFIKLFAEEDFPVIATKMVHKRTDDMEIAAEEKRDIETHFLLEEYKEKYCSRNRESSKFMLLPACLREWAEREKTSGRDPDPESAADHILYLLGAARYSRSPKKANGIADCAEKMLSPGYGRSSNSADKGFQQDMSYVLHRKGAIFFVREIRERYPEADGGYSIYIDPLWLEESGIGRQESRAFIRELSMCSHLSISGNYPRQEYLRDMLRSGKIPFSATC